MGWVWGRGRFGWWWWGFCGWCVGGGGCGWGGVGGGQRLLAAASRSAVECVLECCVECALIRRPQLTTHSSKHITPKHRQKNKNKRVTGRGHIDINRISGYIPGKIVFLLMQVRKCLVFSFCCVCVSCVCVRVGVPLCVVSCCAPPPSHPLSHTQKKGLQERHEQRAQDLAHAARRVAVQPARLTRRRQRAEPQRRGVRRRAARRHPAARAAGRACVIFVFLFLFFVFFLWLK